MTEVLEREEIETSSEIYFDTFEEWLRWAAHQEEWTELEDGKVIFVHRNLRGEYVGVKIIHQIIVKFLILLIERWLQRENIHGLVLPGPVMMRTRQHQRYGCEPDVLYLTPENRQRARETFIDGPADICVEVVSPESVERDRDVKFLEYQEAGVGEYWIIDPDARSAQFWRLDETNQYRRVPLDSGGVYTCAVIPGLMLRPAWLWEDPVPTPEVWESFWSASR